MSNSKENQKSIDPYADALHFLGATTITGIDNLKSRYRELAMNYHPDKGGNLELMQKLNESYNIALRYCKQNNPVGKENELTFAPEKDEEDSFTELFARFAQDTPFETPKKQPSPKNSDNAWYEKPQEPSHFSSTMSNNEENLFDFQLRMSKIRIESQYNKIADVHSLPDILSSLFGTRGVQHEVIQKSQDIFKDKNPDEIKYILLLASHIVEPAIQIPVHYSLSIAEAIGYAPYHKGMIKISKQCETFLFDTFKLFITPTNEKALYSEQNNLFIFLFRHMFRLLNDTHSDEKINEKIMFFKNSHKKINSYISSDLEDKSSETSLEKAKLFGLIFHDGMSMQDRLDMVDACHTILNFRYSNTYHDIYKKIQSVFTYCELKNWSVQKTQKVLQSMACIQGKHTRINSLGQQEKLFSFYEKLEQMVCVKKNMSKHDEVSSQIYQFILSVKHGSRGYRDGRDEYAINEWVEAFENGFEVFQQEPILFNAMMDVFHEFSISPPNKLVFSRYDSIRIPIETAVKSALRLMAFLNTHYGDELFDKQEDLKKLKKLIHFFQQNRYFEIHKRQNYSSLPLLQQKLYCFFNSIQRRRTKKGMFLPEDIDTVIDLCF